MPVAALGGAAARRLQARLSRQGVGTGLRRLRLQGVTAQGADGGAVEGTARAGGGAGADPGGDQVFGEGAWAGAGGPGAQAAPRPVGRGARGTYSAASA